MRNVYKGLTVLLLVVVVVQFYLAGVGAFTGTPTSNTYLAHKIIGGSAIPVLSLLATITAAILRLPGRQIGLTLLPAALAGVQVLIVVLGRTLTGTAEPIVLGLHAVNALAILGVVINLVVRARRLPATSTAAARQHEVPVA